MVNDHLTNEDQFYPREPQVETEQAEVDTSDTRGSRYIDKGLNSDDAQLTLYGGNSYDYCGYSTAFGDIDNDGYDDLVVGVPYGDGSQAVPRTSSGEVLVYYGHDEQTFPGTTMDLAQNKYDMIIYGALGNGGWGDAGDTVGHDVATGDINGDGYDDMVMGAPTAQLNGNRRDAGAVFVVYGDTRANQGPILDLASDRDFVIWGVNWEGGFGRSVACGDFNNDGYDDIVAGEPYGDPGDRTNAGYTFVVFGDNALGASEDLWRNARSPSTIVINGDKARNGNDEGDLSGWDVATGNIDGNDYDDIIIGAPYGQTGGVVNRGVTYVIVGSASMSTTINLANQARSNIWGDDANDLSGYTVATGDIDGDQMDDILIGAMYADGQSNNKQYAGDMYVLFGSTSIAQNVNLGSDYDMAVYGNTDVDLLGMGIAAGDLNGDQFDDFVVGARYNDAGDAGITDAGAAYIFFGDSRGNLVRNLDPKINADGQIYGVNASTQLGYALAIGDYDGDGAGDIVVTGYAADGPLNARDDCGEVYLFYGAAPPVKINSVELLDSGSEPTVIIYSNYETYTFRVNVTMIIGADDLEKVELTLDPGGEDLTYKYNHLTTQFSKVQDTGGLTKLESKLMDAVQTGPFYWELDFKLEFDWEFPASGLLAVKIKAEGIRCPESEKTFSNVFRVEDDLELNGALKVYDDENVLLADGDWIAGGETVAFTGLTAVYEGTTDIYPPDGEFTIKVSDNDGIWTNLTGSGDPMHIDATVKLITDPIDVFKVAITAPPSASPGAERIINLSIDAEDPEPPAVIVFKRKTTTSDTVTAINRTTFVMEWGDGSDKFSGIRGYYYSLVNNEGFKDGTYTTDTSATLSDMPTGQQNMYIWAIDIAGNIGKAASGTIFIDLTSPKFSDFEPAGTDWLTEAVFTCEIELDDGEGVGVDTGTIVYKISTRGAGAYDAWLTATDIEPLGGNKLKISVDIDDEFIEGEDNWIKFKAMDLAGNQMESPDYNLKLDVSKIEYELEEPNVLSKQADSEVIFTITIRDDVSDVDTAMVEYRFSVSGTGSYGDWTSEGIYPVTETGKEVYGHRFRVDLTLLPGKNNYIKWRAMDNAGNGYYESRDYQIWVNTPPQPLISGPEIDAKFDEGKAVTFSAKGTADADNDTLSYKWRSSIDGEFGYIPEMTYKLSPGVHEITLFVDDGISVETASISVEIEEEESALEGKGVLGASNSVDLAFIIILIIIMILILVLFMRSRKQLKEKEDEAKRVTAEVIAPGAMTPAGPGMAAGMGAQMTDYGLQTGYGAQAQPRPQLPGTGQAVPGYDYAAGAGVGVAAGAPQPQGPQTGVVAPARPQLPPAMGAEYPHLDAKQKMDLLEEKFLTGQISENLYMQLKGKYSQDAAAGAGLETPQIQAPGTIQGPIVTGEVVTETTRPPDPGLSFKRPGEQAATPGVQPMPRPDMPQVIPPQRPSQEWRKDEDVLSKIQMPGKEGEPNGRTELNLQTMTKPKRLKKIKKQ